MTNHILSPRGTPSSRPFIAKTSRHTRHLLPSLVSRTVFGRGKLVDLKGTKWALFNAHHADHTPEDYRFGIRHLACHQDGIVWADIRADAASGTFLLNELPLPYQGLFSFHVAERLKGRSESPHEDRHLNREADEEGDLCEHQASRISVGVQVGLDKLPEGTWVSCEIFPARRFSHTSRAMTMQCCVIGVVSSNVSCQKMLVASDFEGWPR